MRALTSTALAFVLLCALPAHAFASSAPTLLTGAELVAAGSAFDGAEVTFEGEVVSEALAGGRGHVWLNVLSGGVAIGAWMPEAMAEPVGSFGRWSHDGDIVRVTGVLNEACDTHGGDFDIHATEVTVLRAGTPRTHPIQYWKLLGGIAGLLAAYLVARRARQREEAPS